MLGQHLPVQRLLLHARQPRPLVRLLLRPPPPRRFTQKSQLLLLSASQTRPQLPFLHSPVSLRGSRATPRSTFNAQLARLLTTERTKYIKEQLWGVARYSAYFWTFVLLVVLVTFGVENERLERNFPSPPMWSWISRWKFRNVKGQEYPDLQGTDSATVDWAHTGDFYRQLLKRLEDPEIDGKGLHPALGDAEGDIYVEGVGRAGLDISSKPEAWIRGYYEVLVGAARAAENLDSWVRDKTRNTAFPSEVVVGPSNPRPKPVPFGAQTAPREQDCEAAFEAPEVYYMKILTTTGFTTAQRLEAALAYADWLEFKQLHSSAGDMYSWALDIALDGLPRDVRDVACQPDGVLNEHTRYITPNLLRATNALATHHAKTGNLSAALAVFLSILRAQRSLLPPPATRGFTPTQVDSIEESAIGRIFSSIFSFIKAPAYPPAPPSGDERAYRQRASVCEEAGTMVHIGEVLFASSDSASAANAPTLQASGLVFTRDAVAQAQGSLLNLSGNSGEASGYDTGSDGTSISVAKERCSECLQSGMANWMKMVERLQRLEAADSKPNTVNQSSTPSTSRLSKWFWGPSSVNNSIRTKQGRWDRELKAVQERNTEIQHLLREESLQQGKKGTGGFLTV